MKKKIFISYSYSNRSKFIDFHQKLKRFLELEFDAEVYSFVFDFTEKVSDKEMMDAALREISLSDVLIVELSNDSVGIGIEAGYAKANRTPIIYLAKEGVSIDPTMSGISDHIVKYVSADDVISWASGHREIFG